MGLSERLRVMLSGNSNWICLPLACSKQLFFRCECFFPGERCRGFIEILYCFVLCWSVDY